MPKETEQMESNKEIQANKKCVDYQTKHTKGEFTDKGKDEKQGVSKLLVCHSIHHSIPGLTAEQQFEACHNYTSVSINGEAAQAISNKYYPQALLQDH